VLSCRPMEQGFVTGGGSQLDRRVVKAGNLFGRGERGLRIARRK
jgi:hypothetical protein